MVGVSVPWSGGKSGVPTTCRAAHGTGAGRLQLRLRSAYASGGGSPRALSVASVHSSDPDPGPSVNALLPSALAPEACRM